MEKTWLVTFLPYSDVTPEDLASPHKLRGYGYGAWDEFIQDALSARARFDELKVSGKIEWIELRAPGGMRGVLVSDWRDTE